MIQLILFLLIGAALVASLIFLVWRSPRAEKGSAALVEARQALVVLQTGLLPMELIGGSCPGRPRIRPIAGSRPRLREVSERAKSHCSRMGRRDQKTDSQFDALSSGFGALLCPAQLSDRTGTRASVCRFTLRLPGAPDDLVCWWAVRRASHRGCNGCNGCSGLQCLGAVSRILEFGSSWSTARPPEGRVTLGIDP